MKRCIVFCAGRRGLSRSGFCIGPEELVIACDAGYRSAREAGVLPHLLIGDFDSLGEQLPEGIETLRFPVEKDDTDGMLALREGLRPGLPPLCPVLCARRTPRPHHRQSAGACLFAGA